jgi:hypothetical protein
LKKNCEDQILETLNKNIKDLSILAPISNDINYGFFDQFKNPATKNNFKVDYVKGFAMLVDIKK